MSTQEHSAAGAPETPQTPAPDAAPAPAPAAAPEPEGPPPVYAQNEEGVPTIHGAPIFTLENPYGGQGFGWLVAIDPDATHEQGQRMVAPGTDVSEERILPRSGGAALYADLSTGKMWSVPLNPEAVPGA